MSEIVVGILKVYYKVGGEPHVIRWVRQDQAEMLQVVVNQVQRQMAVYPYLQSRINKLFAHGFTISQLAKQGVSLGDLNRAIETIHQPWTLASYTVTPADNFGPATLHFARTHDLQPGLIARVEFTNTQKVWPS